MKTWCGQAWNIPKALAEAPKLREQKKSRHHRRSRPACPQYCYHTKTATRRNTVEISGPAGTFNCSPPLAWACFTMLRCLLLLLLCSPLPAEDRIGDERNPIRQLFKGQRLD